MDDATAPAARKLTRLLATGFAFTLILGAVQWRATYEVRRADGVAYGCIGMAIFWCACATLPFTKAARGRLKLRWLLFTGGLLTLSLAYGLSWLTNLRYVAWLPMQIKTIALGALAEALFLLAATLFFSGSTRIIAVFDGLQALLFAALRFQLTYASDTHDNFAKHHYEVANAAAFFLFVTALIATLGSVSQGERVFLRRLSIFLGLRFLAFFFGTQVFYLWMNNPHSTPWDVTVTLLFAGFALYLARQVGVRGPARGPVRGPARVPRVPLQPSIAARSLMPSVLALGNFALALCLLGRSKELAAGGLVLALIFYVTRMVMLQNNVLIESTQLQQRNDELELLAAKDPLTSAGNRRSLAAAYHQVLSRPLPGTVALMLFDVDRFKQANDRHGHIFGDQVLVDLSTILHDVAHSVPSGHCARFGGDEFALLLPDLMESEAREKAEEICRRARTELGGVPGRVTSVSIGLGMAGTAESLLLAELISRADKALYRAKVLGRDRVELGTGADDEPNFQIDAAEFDRARLKPHEVPS